MKLFHENEINRIIEMAWEDRTPFDAIFQQFGIKEPEVKRLMQHHLKASSYILWRKRVHKRFSKHLQKRDVPVLTFKSNAQRSITLNKLSKRK